MAAPLLQGWYPDPFGAHSERYFSDGQPTKLVRDDGVESYDEPPGALSPAAVAAMVSKARSERPTSLTPDGGPGSTGGPSMSAYLRDGATRRRRRRVAAAVGAPVLVAGVVVAIAAGGGPSRCAGASCSSSPTGKGVSAAAVYQATVDERSADEAMDFTVQAGASTRSRFTSVGSYSWAAQEGSSAYRMSFGPTLLLTMHEVVLGNRTWIRFDVPANTAGGLSAGVLGSGKWDETIWVGSGSSSKPTVLSGLFGGAFMSPGGSPKLAPGELLSLLTEVASSVTEVGTSVSDGVTLTHYRARVSYRALGASPADVVQAEQETGSDAMYFDYWIDPADYLREMRLTLTILRDPDDGGTATTDLASMSPVFPITLTTDLRLSDYGVSVSVDPPAQSQVGSVTTCNGDSSSFACS